MIIKPYLRLFILGLLAALCLANNNCLGGFSRKEKSTFGLKSSNTSNQQGQPSPKQFLKKLKAVVVLLEGLGMDERQFETIEKQLKIQFDDTILIIKPKYRQKKILYQTPSQIYPLNWPFMLSCCIPTQSAGVFEEIKSVLQEQGIQKGAYPPLVIIGISQGGLLAPIIADNYHKELNIQGIVTINAPLAGIDWFNNGMKKLKTFLTNAKDGLKEIGLTSKDVDDIESNSSKNLSLMQIAFGVKGMLPNSPSVNKSQKFIFKASIPCLLIGSRLSNIFSNIEHASYQKTKGAIISFRSLSQANPIAEGLEKAYAALITGRADGYHDGLIPTSSQLLLENDKIKVLPGNTVVQEGNIFRVCVVGPTHASVIVPIMSWPQIPIDRQKVKVIEDDPSVAGHIVHFIDKHIINKM